MNKGNNDSSKAGNNEDKVDVAFRMKRANVFSGIGEIDETGQIRETYVAKTIPKSTAQGKIISAALSENYIFAGMSEDDKTLIGSRMDIVNITKGETVIQQGSSGDYFYIIESGTFTILVDDKPVAEFGKGKSFGELALVYDAPRQATVKADTEAVVFTLDREAFRNTIAQTSSNKTEDIRAALKNVELLADLTDDQLYKISDSVEVFTYNEGDVIINKGEEGKVFYMVKEGTVKVTDVGTQFQDHTLGPGTYFGERALLTGEPRAATITAQSKKVLLMALDREAFQSLLGPLSELLNHNMNFRVLTSVKLFEKLSGNEKMKLSQSFNLETFKKGATVIKQGDKGSKFYILKSGLASVQADKVEVTQLAPGTYFGEMALLGDDVRKASVLALEDCECFVLDRDTFVRILGSMQHLLNKETMTRMDQLNETQRLSETAVELDLTLAELKTLGLLGTGTFGRVSLVQDPKTKKVYALKAMRKAEIVAHKQQLNVMNEKRVMQELRHPFVLRLHKTFKDQHKLYMLLDFVQGGELFSVLHTAKGDGVPDAQAKFYGAGVILALEHMHLKNVAYRDMKPENCLIDRQGYTKLVDFGFAKIIVGKAFTLCGTPEYLAPELVLAKGHTKAVDYWAFGVLLYEMVAGYSPYADANMDQVVICKNIVHGKLSFPKSFNSDLKDLIKRLLARDINQRLGNLKAGCDDITNHKWFKSIEFSLLLKLGIEAPWVPAIKSQTDMSNFDPYDEEGDVPEKENSKKIDHSTWDKDF